MSVVTEQGLAKNELPDITVVLVSYNTGYLLERLFATLSAAKADLKLQIILVDNASRDGSEEILKEKYPEVQLIENGANVGFGRANNQAVTQARGRYLLLLNTDAFVAPDTLAKTHQYMEQNPRCGILGVKLVGEDGSLQPSCRYFPTPWNVFLAENGLGRHFPKVRMIDDMAWDHAETRNCDWVPGCFYLVRKNLVEQIGLFDPRFFLYYEEIDHCRRAHDAGWEVTYFAGTQVVHIGGESAKIDTKLTPAGRRIPRLQIESELLYFRKHYGLKGVLAAIMLTVCGSLLDMLKDVVRHRRRHKVQREKLKTVIALLGPTEWATQPTR